MKLLKLIQRAYEIATDLQSPYLYFTYLVQKRLDEHALKQAIQAWYGDDVEVTKVALTEGQLDVFLIPKKPIQYTTFHFLPKTTIESYAEVLEHDYTETMEPDLRHCSQAAA